MIRGAMILSLVVGRDLGLSEFGDKGEDGAGGDGADDVAVGGLDVEGAEAVVVGVVGRFAERAHVFDLFVGGEGGGALGEVVDDDRAGGGLGEGVDVGVEHGRFDAVGHEHGQGVFVHRIPAGHAVGVVEPLGGGGFDVLGGGVDVGLVEVVGGGDAG